VEHGELEGRRSALRRGKGRNAGRVIAIHDAREGGFSAALGVQWI
jgi:hypothetical protein